tara:strand:+ start:296 stop:631 length:336 start_codon:yes stop_codon:yes gene_type:complete
MSRYRGTVVFDNSTEYYEYLRKDRDLKSVLHYATPILAHPTIYGRTTLVADKHVWGYGDRFYNLAHKYYGDAQYWWVIAWYNALPTEADIQNGDLISIPINLEKVLVTLGM